MAGRRRSTSGTRRTNRLAAMQRHGIAAPRSRIMRPARGLSDGCTSARTTISIPERKNPLTNARGGFGTLRAEPWYRRAAEQGNPLAQVQLGLWNGDNPTREMWFRRAADQGFALGQLRLGLMLDGLPSQMWLNRAAAQGLPAAMHALGKMFDMHYDDVEYEYGEFLEEDWNYVDSDPVEYAVRCHAYVSRKLTAAMWCIHTQRYGSAGHSLDEWMTFAEIRHYLAWEAGCEELGSDIFLRLHQALPGTALVFLVQLGGSGGRPLVSRPVH